MNNIKIYETFEDEQIYNNIDDIISEKDNNDNNIFILF